MAKTIEELIKSTNDLDRELQRRKMLVEKWDKTGLLRKLDDKSSKNYAKRGMAQLLENQAKELLRESSNDGNIGGFQNMAFPLVRRVFGPLFAQELVAIQPLSLPSGLLFFLDFTYGGTYGQYTSGQSVFGNPVGKDIATSGTLGTGGPYLLRYSFGDRIITATTISASSANRIDGTSGSLTGTAAWADLDYDPVYSGSTVTYVMIPTGSLTSSSGSLDTSKITQIAVTTGSAVQLREHNQPIYSGANDLSYVKFYFTGLTTFDAIGNDVTARFPIKGTVTENSGVTVSQVYESDFGTTPAPAIQEIDIKTQSVSVTAETKKLRARWTPELAQDINSYFNLDAEVEITQILSQHITLEIDQEILDMLFQNAWKWGTKKYWSKRVGRYVDEDTGSTLSGTSWTGTRSEWYQTLVETINSCGNTIHKKIMHGKANWIVCGPRVQTMLQSTNLWRANTSTDPKELSFNIGMEKAGSLDNKYNVYVSPYFFENAILVGYKGSEWLATGAVFAPYIPMIMTPTIFQPDSFTPTKGLMTRFAKKVVNPAFYGLVVCEDLNG